MDSFFFKRVFFIFFLGTTFGLVSNGCKSSNNSSSSLKKTSSSVNATDSSSQKFLVVDEQPEPIGGIQEIHKKLRIPDEFLKSEFQIAIVVIRVAIDENGDAIKTVVEKPFGYGCDEAAVEAVMKSKYIPGKIKGNPVKVWLSIPLRFKKR